jgi:hypothetical protein
MLAANFASAEQLCISDKERNALIDVLGRLERGELQHVQWDVADDDHVGFNMGTFKCGSVHCIGGWADRLWGTSLSTGISPINRTALYNLLYVAHDGDELEDLVLEDITVAQAAEALRNYLTTGAARWAEVLE